MEKLRKRREEIIQQLHELDEMEKRGKKLKKLIKMVRDEANGVHVAGLDRSQSPPVSPGAAENSIGSRAGQYDRITLDY